MVHDETHLHTTYYIIHVVTCINTCTHHACELRESPENGPAETQSVHAEHECNFVKVRGTMLLRAPV